MIDEAKATLGYFRTATAVYCTCWPRSQTKLIPPSTFVRTELYKRMSITIGQFLVQVCHPTPHYFEEKLTISCPFNSLHVTVRNISYTPPRSRTTLDVSCVCLEGSPYVTHFTDIELPSTLKLPYTDVELQTPDNVVLQCFLIQQRQLVLLTQV